MENIKNLKKIMEKFGISQEFVSKELNVSVRTVFNWIHGKNKPGGKNKLNLMKMIKKYNDVYK